MRLFQVLILPSAKRDVQDARKWYSQFNKELPVRFKDDLRIIIEGLKVHPSTHSLRYKNIRLANLKNFPYAVHYFIKDDFSVVIIAVYHTAVDPARWNERLL